MNFIQDIQNAFLPEIVLTIFILLNIIISLFFSKKTYKLSRWFAILAVALALYSTISMPAAPVSAFLDSFVSNTLSAFFKILILLSTFFIIFLSGNIIKNRRDRAFEFFTILLTGVLGSMCLVSANDFLTLFVSLETLAISCYLLTGFTKQYKAKEAGLKYLILGSVASAILLFGVSYLYGLTGLLNFDAINSYLTISDPPVIFTFAMLLILFGLAFKIGVLPFLNWIPDIYEGANYPTAAFLSVVPKLAGFAVLLRIMILIGSFSPLLYITLTIIATFSIIYGNIGAIRQKNIKRFLGYSSIAHSGYILLGFSWLYSNNIAAILFYLFCYVFMNIGAFAAVILFNKSAQKDAIDAYKGLVYSRPFYVISFMICLLSLAGLPVTSGFLAKIYLFSAVSRVGLIFLPFLLISMLATVVGLYIYLRIIKTMFEQADEVVEIDSKFNSLKFILYFCAAMTFLLCIFANKIIELCMHIAYFI